MGRVAKALSFTIPRSLLINTDKTETISVFRTAAIGKEPEPQFDVLPTLHRERGTYP